MLLKSVSCDRPVRVGRLTRTSFQTGDEFHVEMLDGWVIKITGRNADDVALVGPNWVAYPAPEPPAKGSKAK